MPIDIAVRPIVPADATGLSGCIQRCYGYAYANRLMYEPAALAEQLNLNAYRGVVAVAGGGIIGHIGYNWPNPSATVVEAGTTVVDPDFRGSGILGRLAQALREIVVAEGAIGFLHYPTTAHTVMQKASLKSGGCETGIMLAYLPPESRDQSIGGSGVDRLAVTVVYQPLLDAPALTIFLPDRYHVTIMGFAKRLGLTRLPADDRTDPTGLTQIQRETDQYSQRERLTVNRIGEDLAECIAAAIGASDASVCHVDLIMDQPELHYAVEQLGKLGFVFSAWLPEWNTSDVLRLQYLEEPTVGDLNPILHSSAANDIVRLIRSELGARQTM